MSAPRALPPCQGGGKAISKHNTTWTSCHCWPIARIDSSSGASAVTTHLQGFLHSLQQGFVGTQRALVSMQPVRKRAACHDLADQPTPALRLLHAATPDGHAFQPHMAIRLHQGFRGSQSETAMKWRGCCNVLFNTTLCSFKGLCRQALQLRLSHESTKARHCMHSTRQFCAPPAQPHRMAQGWGAAASPGPQSPAAR